SFGGAESEQLPEGARHGRGHADEAPDVQAPENGGDPANAVDDGAGEDAADAVDESERRSEESQLDGVEVDLLFEEREDGEDGLAVGVIEKGDAPEHPHDGPFVTAGCHVWPWRRKDATAVIARR